MIKKCFLVHFLLVEVGGIERPMIQNTTHWLQELRPPSRKSYKGGHGDTPLYQCRGICARARVLLHGRACYCRLLTVSLCLALRCRGTAHGLKGHSAWDSQNSAVELDEKQALA